MARGRRTAWHWDGFARLPLVLQAVLLFLAYLLLVELSSRLILKPEDVGVWWVPQGLALATFLISPRRNWPALCAAVFLAESVGVLAHGTPARAAVTWAVVACLEPVAGAWLLERWPGKPVTLCRVRDVLWLTVLGGLVVPALGALPAAAAATGWLGAPSYWKVWLSWTLSDALGTLSLAPVLLTWSAPRDVRFHGRRRVEGAVLFLLLAGVAAWVFGADLPERYITPLPYLVFPFALWAALRIGPLGAAGATLLIVTVAVVHTVGGTGPFGVTELPPRQRVWLLQAFLAVVCVSTLALAASVAEHRTAERRQALLVRAGELFAASLNQEATLGKFSRLLVSELAEGFAVLLRKDGVLAPVAVAHLHAHEEERLWKRLLVPAEPWGGSGDERELHVPISFRGLLLGELFLVRGERSPPFSPEERRLVEELARRCAQALEMMRLFQERGEAIAARDEFLSIAAHELRTPLTSLQLQLHSFGRLLRDTSADSALSEKLQVVNRQGSRLTHLVEALLDVARLSTGQLQMHREEFDLAELARDVTARFAEDLKRAGCELQLRAQPVWGCWDRLRVEQVLTNLLANAIKFGPGRPVEVRVENEGGYARLEVGDQGLGISPEAQGRIFERFERAVSFRSYGGLGLGLYVSKQIVEAHKGRISVSSEPGSGATFTVELPALPHQRQATTAEARPHS